MMFLLTRFFYLMSLKEVKKKIEVITNKIIILVGGHTAEFIFYIMVHTDPLK